MSHRSKSKAKEKRKQLKRGRKAAQKARYDEFKKKGQNTKSKRFQLAVVRKQMVRPTRHATGPCGNIGCLRCSPCAVPRIGHRAWLYAQRKKAA